MSDDELSEDERRLVAEWIVGERSANDPVIVALGQRFPALRQRVTELRKTAGRLGRDGSALRGELEAALRGRATLRDLDHVGELVARAMRERLIE